LTRGGGGLAAEAAEAAEAAAASLPGSGEEAFLDVLPALRRLIGGG
jgi:hypothetical protein